MSKQQSSMRVSHDRLRRAEWKLNSDVQRALNVAGVAYQGYENGSGVFVYDEYSVVVQTMPNGTTPEDYLMEMATDINGTVCNGGFNAMNVFRRSTSGTPRIGEIIHIDILGPDNGSVMLVETSPAFCQTCGNSAYFVFQTVKIRETGEHPENGAREFGFERTQGGIKFYTRGVSSPSNMMVRVLGAGPQAVSWSRLMRGISDSIDRRGGKSVPNSFGVFKETKSN